MAYDWNTTQELAEATEEVKRELHADERLVWVGRPTRYKLRPQDFFPMLFGLLFVSFAVFWIASAAGLGKGSSGGSVQSSLFPLFGIPFVLVGLCVMLSPLWLARRAKRSIYAISNRRAIILERSGLNGSKSVRSFEGNELAFVDRLERSDGSGDLTFTREPNDSNSSHHPFLRPVGFIGVERVRDVQALLQEIRPPSVPHHS